MKKSRKKLAVDWRYIVWWFLIVAFIWIVTSRYTEIKKLIQILSQGRWSFVLLAAFMQLLFLIFHAAIYQSAFRAAEIKMRLSQLVPLSLLVSFVNVVVPSVGASGAAVYIDQTRKLGYSSIQTLASIGLAYLVDLISFVLVLMVGLFYLSVYGQVKGYITAASFILLVVILLTTFFLFFGQRLRVTTRNFFVF